MKHLLLLMTILAVFSSIGQSKLDEKYFESSGRQRANFIINRDGLTYTFINQSVGTDYGHYNHADCKLYITNGNTIIDSFSILDQFAPNPGGYGWDPFILNAHVDTIGNIHMFYFPAGGYLCLEKGEYGTQNIKYLKLNQYGFVEWDEYITNQNEKSIAFRGKRVYAYYSDPVNNVGGLKTYDGNGALITVDNIPLPLYEDLHLYYSGHDKLIAATQTELLEIDILNGITASIPLHFDVNDYAYFNGEDYLLSNDYVYHLNSAFQLQDSTAIPSGYDMHKLKVLNNELYTSGTNNTEILVIKNAFNINNQILNTISINSDTSIIYDFTANQLNLLEDFNTAKFSQVRKQDYTVFGSNNNYQYTGGDVELVDFQFDYLDVDYEFYLAFPAFHWTTTYTGNLKIKNTGTNTIESVQIHYKPYAYHQGCHVIYKDSLYTNLNLAPGAEMNLYIDTIIDEESYVDTSGIEAYFPVCFFATAVNNLIDTNSQNNSFCEYLPVGFSGIDEEMKALSLSLSPNPVKKTFYINGAETGTLKIKIYAASGEMMKKLTLDSLEKEIDITEFPPGIYFVKIVAEDSGLQQNLRLIKI